MLEIASTSIQTRALLYDFAKRTHWKDKTQLFATILADVCWFGHILNGYDHDLAFSHDLRQQQIEHAHGGNHGFDELQLDCGFGFFHFGRRIG